MRANTPRSTFNPHGVRVMQNDLSGPTDRNKQPAHVFFLADRTDPHSPPHFATLIYTYINYMKSLITKTKPIYIYTYGGVKLPLDEINTYLLLFFITLILFNISYTLAILLTHV